VLLSGVGGLPGADDLDDIISGLMQSLGYNFDSKAKRKAFLAEYLGDGAAQFMERGVSGLAGVPIDISGRMGLGNLIPALARVILLARVFLFNVGHSGHPIFIQNQE
jgi:hypothetical protein